jgi:hypothetical protein
LSSNTARHKRALPDYDWDDKAEHHKKHKEKLGNAWEGMLKMAYDVRDKNVKPDVWPRVFAHYFRPEHLIAVDKIFSAIVGEGEKPKDKDGGGKVLGRIILTNKPVPGHEKMCDDGLTAAFTVRINVPPPGEQLWVIRVCDIAYDLPVYTKTGCKKLGDTTSGWMSTLDGVLLHELM